MFRITATVSFILPLIETFYPVKSYRFRSIPSKSKHPASLSVWFRPSYSPRSHAVSYLGASNVFVKGMSDFFYLSAKSDPGPYRPQVLCLAKCTRIVIRPPIVRKCVRFIDIGSPKNVANGEVYEVLIPQNLLTFR